MTYLITGGAGFIGSHLAEHLVSSGENVRILDDFSTGKAENIDGLGVEVIEGDYRDPACLEPALRGVDVVFHQAALCSVARSIADPVSTHEVNGSGTLALLEASRHAGVRRVVCASSSSVYGDSAILPKFEGMREGPISPYAISKLMGEHYCKVYATCFGLETVSLRYFNVFGPRQDPYSEYAAVIPKFLDAILAGDEPVIYGDGTQSRDFTFVDNVVHANMLAAERRGAVGEVFNVGCGGRVSLLELIDALSRILGVEIRPRFVEARKGDVAHSQASIRKPRFLMGFEPVTTFEEGLELTVDWYRQYVGTGASRTIREAADAVGG